MKLLFQIVLSICVISNAFGQIDGIENINTFPLKSVKTYCQSSPDILRYQTDYYYDSCNVLSYTVRTSQREDSDTSIVEYDINDNGLLISKKSTTSIVFEDSVVETHISTRTYDYNENNDIVYSGFAKNQGNGLEYRFYYSESNQLDSQLIIYGSNRNVIEFKYDASGNLIKEFRNGRKNTFYKYKKSLLTKKIQFRHHGFSFRWLWLRLKSINVYNGYQMRTISNYEYDELNRVLLVEKKEHIILQNIYANGRLIERWEGEFQGDCITTCCNYTIKRYSYY